MILKSCTWSLLAILLVGFAVHAAEVRGVIASADAKKQEVTVEARGRGVRGLSLTFTLDKGTEILVGKQAGTVDDLAAGKRVRIVYELQGGRRVALRILLHGGGVPAVAMPAPAAPAAPAAGANTVAGTLRRVAYTDREIVVVRPGAKDGAEVETTVSVPKDVKITRNQKPLTFEELGESEQVTVTTEKKEGKLVAKSIQVGTVATGAASPMSDRKEKIEKARQILKMIDFALQRLGDR